MKCPNCAADNAETETQCKLCGHAFLPLTERELNAYNYIKDAKVFGLAAAGFIGLAILLQFFKPSENTRVVTWSANIAWIVLGGWALLRYFVALIVLEQKAPYAGQVLLGFVAGLLCLAFAGSTLGMTLIAFFFINRELNARYNWSGFTVGCFLIPVLLALMTGVCFFAASFR